MNGKQVVVLGMMSRHPVAGIIWLTVQYLVGLRRLGYEPKQYTTSVGRAGLEPATQGL